MILHCYCWAIPDRRYSHWVKANSGVFYFLSAINVFVYFAGLICGILMYVNSRDGLVQIIGLSLAAF